MASLVCVHAGACPDTLTRHTHCDIDKTPTYWSLNDPRSSKQSEQRAKYWCIALAIPFSPHLQFVFVHVRVCVCVCLFVYGVRLCQSVRACVCGGGRGVCVYVCMCMRVWESVCVRAIMMKIQFQWAKECPWMCITYIGANMPQSQPMPSVTLQRVQRACTTCFTSRLQLLGESLVFQLLCTLIQVWFTCHDPMITKQSQWLFASGKSVARMQHWIFRWVCGYIIASLHWSRCKHSHASWPPRLAEAFAAALLCYTHQSTFRSQPILWTKTASEATQTRKRSRRLPVCGTATHVAARSLWPSFWLLACKRRGMGRARWHGVPIVGSQPQHLASAAMLSATTLHRAWENLLSRLKFSRFALCRLLCRPYRRNMFLKTAD